MNVSKKGKYPACSAEVRQIVRSETIKRYLRASKLMWMIVWMFLPAWWKASEEAYIARSNSATLGRLLI